MSETSIQKAERQYAQAKARLNALKARESKKRRRLQTRQKVILGAALIELAERDEEVATLVRYLIHYLPREHDRNAFLDFQLKQK